MRSLELELVEDDVVRENFRKLKDYLYNFPILRGQFVHMEQSLAASSYPATVRIQHGLGFKPKDIIQTSLIGTGTLDWEYDLSTEVYIYATISAAVTVRAFVGSYQEGSRA